MEKENNNQTFTDLKFPAAFKSLWGYGESGNPNADRKFYKELIWCRPKKIFQTENYRLFDDISPNDIIQGQLGNCYFLSSVAAIAEYQHRIKRLFLKDTKSSIGCYSVALNICGEWREILVDDQFPCLDWNPPQNAFNCTSDKELWASLLEKAYAKVFKGYGNINLGWAEIAMNHLTGAPTKLFFIVDNDDDNKSIIQETNNNSKKRFQQIWEADRDKHIMCCTSYSPYFTNTQYEMESVGLICDHIYTLLGAFTLKKKAGYWSNCTTYNATGGDSVRLVHLRNPHGKNEWNGDWCDSSSEWHYVNKAAKEKLGHKDEDDGTFFMKFEDFENHFREFSVCYYYDDYKLSSFKTQTSDDEVLNLEFDINVDGEYYFNLHQKEARHFQKVEEYCYSNITMMVMCKEYSSNKWKLVGSARSTDYLAFFKANCKSGKYYVSIFTPWDANSTDLCFGTYGVGNTKINKVAYGTLKDQWWCEAFKSHSKNASEEYVEIWPGYQEFLWKNVDVDETFGYYIVQNNHAHTTITYWLNMAESTDVHLQGHNKDQQQVFTVIPPNDYEVIWYRYASNWYKSYTETWGEVECYCELKDEIMQKKNRKTRLSKQKKNVGINQYVYHDEDTSYFMFVNESEKYTLVEAMRFELDNCRIISTDLDYIKIKVRPGQTKCIAIVSYGGHYTATQIGSDYEIV